MSAQPDTAEGPIGGNEQEEPHEYVPVIKRFIANGEDGPARAILVRLVDVIEREGRRTGEGVPPWYYEQLADIYRRHLDYKREVEIIERFAAQHNAPGASTQALLTRLGVARQLLNDHGDLFGLGRGVPYQTP